MTVRSTAAALALAIAATVQPLQAEEEALVSFQVLTPDTAVELAQATLEACREKGFQIAVSVVDRMGVPQVMIRDRYAGAHTPETARRKAWTAVSFRTDTVTMMEETQAGKMQSGVRFISEAMMVGGGVPVNAGGSMIGGVGVSGAPGGDLDDECAREGIAAIEDKLLF